MKNQNNKKVLLTVMFVAILTIAVIGTSFAFFNYTRIGSSNTVKTGTINFTSSQSGTFNLTNVFPIATGDVLSDSNNSQEVVITVSGDTTYSQGIEYLVTLEDVNVRTNTYKKVPVGLMVTPEKTGELGTSDNAYFTNRGGSTSIYKSFIGQSDILEDGQYVLVGYIRPGEAEVNGTIGIRAFIDKDSIAITDTPEENTEWQNGRMVLSTSEWNSLQTNGITFKVRVVANEGVWVGEPSSRNDLKNFYSTLTSEQKSAITEINFIRMSEEMINTHADLIDLTASGGQGVVKGWIENNKLYIASPGVTYFPENSAGLLNSFSNVTKINFNNVNTSNVTNMNAMFYGCSSLTNIDLSNFDTSNVTNMEEMFSRCSSLANLDLTNFNTNKVIDMGKMFYNCANIKNINISGLGNDNVTFTGGVNQLIQGCINVENINMSNFNFGRATDVNIFFSGLSKLENVNLSNANLSNVTSFTYMFQNCIKLENINLTGVIIDNAENMTGLFYGCSSLKSLDLSSFDTSSVVNFNQMFSGCSSLTSLDLSSFDTSASNGSNGNAYNMFNGCTNLKTIYVSNLWDMTAQPSDMPIFTGCTSLVGGNGTVFDSSKIDKTMAVIDTPSTPGYLTLKNS